MDNNKEHNQLAVGGIFHLQHIRNGEIIDHWDQKNRVVNEGLDYILGAALYSATDLAYGYISLYTATGVSPAYGHTLTTLASGTYAEVATTTNVSNTGREAWVVPGVASQGLTNAASPAAFTFAADTNVKGAALVFSSGATSAFGSTSGVLIAASNFTAPRSMLAGDVLNVSYAINISAV